MHLAPRLLALMLSFAVAAPATAAVFELEVMRGKGAAATNSGFDGWAADAAKLARTVDESFDFACTGMTIARAGDVKEHPTIPKLIDSAALIDKIRQVSADVFVVDSLLVCGGNTGVFAGCELSIGPIILVSSPNAFRTLIHELGHERNIPHTFQTGPACTPTRPPGLSEEKFVNFMYCRSHTRRRVLTEDNCRRLVGPTVFAAMTATPPAAAAVSSEAAAQPPAATPFEEFLLSGFSEGIPYAEIAALSENEIAEARRALAGPNSELWASAAIVLGLRGNAEDARAIMALAGRIAGDASAAAFRARTVIPTALGLFVAGQGAAAPDDVLVFLLEGVDAAAAARLSSTEEAPLIARSFARGVALTGRLPAAEAALDIARAQSARAAPAAAAVGSAFDQDFLDELAGVALSANTPGAAAAAVAPQPGNAVEALRARSAQDPVDPAVAQALRGLGVTSSPVLQRYDAQPR